MKFSKMHGTGNDYVFVNGWEEMVENPAGLARRISDRHTGVGSDGLVLMMPSDVADVRMRMFNADGSEAEMCGNAIRCVGKYVFDRGIVRKELVRVETKAGTRDVLLHASGQGVWGATVNMGRPEWRAGHIPVRAEGEWTGGIDVDTGEGVFTVVCVSMGNPHAVVFTDDAEAAPVERAGPFIEAYSAFPNRTNVEFVQWLSERELRVRVWERGSGETRACGTGACAAAVVSARLGKAARKVRVHLAGGWLDVDWREDGDVHLTGEAVHVYTGIWDGGT